MTCLRVVTESGSVYRLDVLRKTLQRTPGVDAGSVALDGAVIHYDALASFPQPGCGMCFQWTTDEGRRKLRITTPVVSIEEIPSE